MSFGELLIIAVGLSMDAFAVAICTGLTMRRVTLQKMLTVGGYFGFFQALMPLLGYLLGTRFAQSIEAFDHWIAFFLLALIGGRMAVGSLKKGEADALCCGVEASLAVGAMLPLAVATSIDALAVGVSFACLHVQILPAVCLIGLTTLALSASGVQIGQVFGLRYKAGAELTGGIVLVLMGVKILLEHTGIL
ncbi:MAG: manganese efflux pump [Clostridiales bacterium]|nr:manganese efflux pump [Clostridiales bacterium]